MTEVLRFVRKIFLFLFFFADIVILHSQTVITSGTIPKVSAGKIVTENSRQVINSTGTIDNKGTIGFRGNFLNIGAVSIGNGTFLFSCVLLDSNSGNQNQVPN